ncbi:MAG: toprim domain-containing protein [Dermatophilaceae bacterium]
MLLERGGVPVLVEGPLDALAITTAGQGRYVGLAPLGTALTEEQAHQVAALAHPWGAAPVVAADADTAGRQVTDLAYWLLTQHGLSPAAVAWQPGSGPADTLTRHGRPALRQALEIANPLAQHLLDQRLARVVGLEALRRSVAVVAAGSPDLWSSTPRRSPTPPTCPCPWCAATAPTTRAR